MTNLKQTIFTVVTIEDQWISNYNGKEVVLDFSDAGKAGKAEVQGKIILTYDEFRNSLKQRDLIKISAIKFKFNQQLGTYLAYIRPSQPLNDITKILSGVSELDMEQAVDLSDALRGLSNFCQGSILVCHNQYYVMETLSQKLAECRLPALPNLVLDTYQFVRFLYPLEQYGSRRIAKHYGVKDELLTYEERIVEIFKHICQELSDKYHVTTLKELLEFGRIRENREERMN